MNVYVIYPKNFKKPEANLIDEGISPKENNSELINVETFHHRTFNINSKISASSAKSSSFESLDLDLIEEEHIISESINEASDTQINIKINTVEDIFITNSMNVDHSTGKKPYLIDFMKTNTKLNNTSPKSTSSDKSMPVLPPTKSIKYIPKTPDMMTSTISKIGETEMQKRISESIIDPIWGQPRKASIIEKEEGKMNILSKESKVSKTSSVESEVKITMTKKNKRRSSVDSSLKYSNKESDANLMELLKKKDVKCKYSPGDQQTRLKYQNKRLSFKSKNSARLIKQSTAKDGQLEGNFLNSRIQKRESFSDVNSGGLRRLSTLMGPTDTMAEEDKINKIIESVGLGRKPKRMNNQENFQPPYDDIYCTKISELESGFDQSDEESQYIKAQELKNKQNKLKKKGTIQISTILPKYKEEEKNEYMPTNFEVKMRKSLLYSSGTNYLKHLTKSSILSKEPDTDENSQKINIGIDILQDEQNKDENSNIGNEQDSKTSRISNQIDSKTNNKTNFAIRQAIEQPFVPKFLQRSKYWVNILFFFFFLGSGIYIYIYINSVLFMDAICNKFRNGGEYSEYKLFGT